jgi:general secretion pathway protein G
MICDLSFRKNHQLSMINRQYGFTLIELLVVIAIIGVLSALLMSNFIAIRQRARDGNRKTNLRELQSALEIYRANKGDYPDSLTACDTPLTDGITVYKSKIPCDPLGGDYQYNKNGATYTLTACLENGNDGEIEKNNNTPVNCDGSTTLWKYIVTNP